MCVWYLCSKSRVRGRNLGFAAADFRVVDYKSILSGRNGGSRFKVRVWIRVSLSSLEPWSQRGLGTISHRMYFQGNSRSCWACEPIWPGYQAM